MAAFTRFASAKSLLRWDDFRKQRLEYGLVEYGVVVAGGYDMAGSCRVLAAVRRAVAVDPADERPWLSACSVIIDNGCG